MGDIKERLKETSNQCLSCYESWQKNQKDAAAREALVEAVHEIRKVASRVEIELAVSERDQMTQKQIPIPPHRDARNRGRGGSDNVGNQDKPKKAGNRKPPKKEAQGNS